MGYVYLKTIKLINGEKATNQHQIDAVFPHSFVLTLNKSLSVFGLH